MESAQARWRAVNAPHLVALVRAGATFVRHSRLVHCLALRQQSGTLLPWGC